jgi:hypothetical protein
VVGVVAWDTGIPELIEKQAVAYWPVGVSMMKCPETVRRRSIHPKDRRAERNHASNSSWGQ